MAGSTSTVCPFPPIHLNPSPLSYSFDPTGQISMTEEQILEQLSHWHDAMPTCDLAALTSTRPSWLWQRYLYTRKQFRRVMGDQSELEAVISHGELLLKALNDLLGVPELSPAAADSGIRQSVLKLSRVIQAGDWSLSQDMGRRSKSDATRSTFEGRLAALLQDLPKGAVRALRGARNNPAWLRYLRKRHHLQHLLCEKRRPLTLEAILKAMAEFRQTLTDLLERPAGRAIPSKRVPRFLALLTQLIREGEEFQYDSGAHSPYVTLGVVTLSQNTCSVKIREIE
jgi:hypothetical protein